MRGGEGRHIINFLLFTLPDFAGNLQSCLAPDQGVLNLNRTFGKGFALELLSLVKDGQTALSTATHAALEANGIRLLPSHVERIAAAKRNALAETDRIELRSGTIDAVVEAFADSPFLQQNTAAATLADAVEAFYAVRDDAPTEVPDEEIMDALRVAFDAAEGSTDALDALSIARDLALREHEANHRAAEASGQSLPGGAYTIVDDEGRTYRWAPADWEYDELTPGWNGEEWACDLD